jgi:hypothetical protein
MRPNLAKSLLQGGWMVGAVKHNRRGYSYNINHELACICEIEEWVHLFYLSICLFIYYLFTPPEPGLFKAILNSFPRLNERVK